MDPDLAALLVDLARSRHLGKFRGTVIDNADPLKKGRLKIECPDVLDTVQLWAMPCVPYAGKKVGFFAMPPKGAGVWIEFENGDASLPIWVGCFWAKDEMPDGGGVPDVKLWKTDSIKLLLDDKEDDVLLENSSSASIKMTDEIVSTAKQGKHTVASSAVTSEAGGKGKLEVKTASVSVNSGTFEVS